MASPSSIRDFRFLTGTTFNKTFTNAASSSWNCIDDTATKLRITEYDPSGLQQENFQDESLRTRFFGKASSINGLRKGSYKISTYCGGAWTNIDYTPEENLMNVAAGGLAMPLVSRTAVCGANCTSTVLNIADLDTLVVAGQGVLVGAVGDGRGGGEVRSFNSIASTLGTMGVALAVAPNAGDAVVFSSTIYPDQDSTQQYVDSLVIGHGTADQRQTVGGVPLFSITNMGPSAAPKTEFEVKIADHQWVTTAGDKSTLTSSKDPVGQEPAFERAIGMVHLGDNNSSTRTVVKCGDITFNTGMTYEEIPDFGGVNGLGGWQKMPGVPILEMTLLIDEDAGVMADFNAQTAKHVIVQMGHAAGACCAIEMQEAYIDKLPESVNLGNLQGMKLVMHGEEEYSATSDILSACWRVHKF